MTVQSASASLQREGADADFFVPNKYKIWYDKLILKSAFSKNQSITGDLHHIIPRSLGGTNDPQNIVKLTYRHHFLAHWLLTKFTKGEAKKKCLYALSRMLCRNKKMTTPWQYEVSRKAAVGAQIGNQYSLGRRHSNETKAKLRKKYYERKSIKKTTIINSLLGFGG